MTIFVSSLYFKYLKKKPYGRDKRVEKKSRYLMQKNGGNIASQVWGEMEGKKVLGLNYHTLILDRNERQRQKKNEMYTQRKERLSKRRENIQMGEMKRLSIINRKHKKKIERTNRKQQSIQNFGV